MIDHDFETFLHTMRTHTALGRVALGELRAAFEFARQQGFTVKKSDVAEAVV